MGIGRRVDIGWEMGCHVVDSLRQQLFVDLVEEVLDLGRVLFEGVGKGVAGGNQLLLISTVEQHKHPILDLQVGKGQFDGTVFIARGRHQFVDVFLQMDL